MKLPLSDILLAALLLLGTVSAEVIPSRLFSDHMVIQRDTLAPVWGQADPGEPIIVTGSWGESGKAIADKNGRWVTKLRTPAAGGPHTITISGENVIEIKQVLSGDVWLCSGQSNMGWPVSKSKDAAEEIKAADHPAIRSFKVARNPRQKAVNDCAGEWQPCSSQTVGEFSATAYFTGRRLHQELGVPIGLLTTCWGGTCVEAWTPWADQAKDPLALKRKSSFDRVAESYSPENAKASYNKKLDAWKRKTAEAKKSKKRGPRKPMLGQDPLLDQNYPGNLYNGMLYPLAPFAVKGVIWYQGENNAKTLQSSTHYRFQLARMVSSWRKTWEKDLPFFSVQLPNYKKPQANPVEIHNTWPLMRESFVYVADKLPLSYTLTTIDLGEANDIHPKNKQTVGFRMASLILNKSYGKKTPTTPFMRSFNIEDNKIRLDFDYAGTGLMARGGKLKGFAVAGENQVFSWADAEIVNDAGGDYVTVSATAIKNPAAVRYAWADNPEGCNLFNNEGFPASPFRTDDWNLATEH